MYPCESDIFNQVFGDNVSLLGVFLSALVYYKSIVSKSNDVLIGVYDNSGSYRPIIFHSDHTFTIKDFLVYVEEQIKLFSEINTDELLNLYREHQIEYEELDFSFSLNNTDYAPGHNRGIIHLSLFNDGTTNHIKYNYNHNCVSHNEINRLQSRINAIVHNFMNNGDGKLFDKDIISDEEKDLI